MSLRKKSNKEEHSVAVLEETEAKPTSEVSEIPKEIKEIMEETSGKEVVPAEVKVVPIERGKFEESLIKKQMANKVVEEMIGNRVMYVGAGRIGKENFKKQLRKVGYSKREAERIIAMERKTGSVLDEDDLRFWVGVR